jgi:hypothetical protein
MALRDVCRTLTTIRAHESREAAERKARAIVDATAAKMSKTPDSVE